MTLAEGLAIAAAVALAALAAHGVWTMRRARPRRALPEAAAAAAASAAAAQRLEPSLGLDPVAAPLPDRRGEPRRFARIDALIDAIVPLALEAPASGEFVLAHLPSTRRAGGKPLLIEGLDAETGEWEPPQPGRRYGELQAAVQLANRSGALNEIEYSEFVQKVEAFAEGIGAMADFPDMLEVVARARELDGLASPLDAQLTATLKANGVAWSVGYVQQCAARQGFVPGAVPGRMVLPPAEDGAPPPLVLTVDAQAALAEDLQSTGVRECQLSLDVPQSPEAAEPFPAWHRSATALADEMDATVVDDEGRPITLHAFAAIGEELQQLYRRLAALDLAAGSPAARRLFS